MTTPADTAATILDGAAARLPTLLTLSTDPTARAVAPMLAPILGFIAEAVRASGRPITDIESVRSIAGEWAATRQRIIDDAAQAAQAAEEFRPTDPAPPSE